MCHSLYGKTRLIIKALYCIIHICVMTISLQRDMNLEESQERIEMKSNIIGKDMPLFESNKVKLVSPRYDMLP